MTDAEFAAMNGRRLSLIEKKHKQDGLTVAEQDELAELQQCCFDYLAEKFPRPELDTARLDEIERRLSI